MVQAAVIMGSVLLSIAGLVSAAFILVSLVTLVYCVAIYKQEKKAMRKSSFLGICNFVYTWVFGSYWAIIMMSPRIIANGFKITPEISSAAFEYACDIGHRIVRRVIEPPLVMGADNLPKDQSSPVIYVANHQSMIDIALLYYLGRRFRWVSKAAVFTIPGVGRLMRCAGDVPLRRGHGGSVVAMFAGCRHSLARERVSVMVFPQGTRARHAILPFKDGAFSLAAELGLCVVPITIDVPEDIWACRHRRCTLTIHKPIQPPGDLPDGAARDGPAAAAAAATTSRGAVALLRQAAYDAVVQALPYYSKELEDLGQRSSEAARRRRQARNKGAGNGGAFPSPGKGGGEVDSEAATGGKSETSPLLEGGGGDGASDPLLGRRMGGGR